MYITINSEFRPFTYDELTKPLRDYTEAYNAVEAQYSNLAQQTEAWKNIATKENSPEAYAMYKRYSDELNAVVEDFSRGMTIQNRSKLLGLKSRYASEITPIANAYNAMQEANKYRETVRAKDGSAVFVKDRYNSLDDFLNGNQADNTFISGDEIQKNVTARVLSQSYTDYNNLINAGVTPDKAIQIITSGNNQSIADIIADKQSSLGIEDFDTQGQAKLNNAILAGIQQGLGSFASKEYMSKAERDNLALQQYKLAEDRRQSNALLRSKGLTPEGKLDPYNPINIASGYKFKVDENGNVVYNKHGEAVVEKYPETEEENKKNKEKTVIVGGLGKYHHYSKSKGRSQNGAYTKVYSPDIVSDKIISDIENNSTLDNLPAGWKDSGEYVVEVKYNGSGEILGYTITKGTSIKTTVGEGVSDLTFPIK